MTRNKIALITLLVALLVLIVLPSVLPKEETEILPIPSPTKITPFPTIINAPGRISISGVEVNDFTSSPLEINEQGDVEFSRTQDFEIGYLRQFTQFIVNIWTPNQAARAAAESDFLDKLGISEAEACRLNVDVAQNYSEDFPQSENRRLSFCQ